VEPGCYFIDALLVPALEDSITSKFFNSEELVNYRNFGGVRIESDLVSLLLTSLFLKLIMGFDYSKQSY